MKVIEKLGGVKSAYKILTESGLKCSLSAFLMQISRGSLSKDVSLCFVSYFNAHGIEYEVADFYNVGEE